MVEKLNTLAAVLLTGEKPRPMEKGGCPVTPVRLTLLVRPVTPSKTAGMSCWKRGEYWLVPWSPKPMVALTLKGPVALTLMLKPATMDLIMDSKGF